jgi:hypothetical protein
MSARYLAQVDEAWTRATCLVACTGVPDRERNAARVVLGQAAFRSETARKPKDVVEERLKIALTATEHCLEVEPTNVACHQLHATARGLLLRGTWNPLNAGAPRALLADLRAARGGAAPGEDLWDGAATRGETILLVRAPRIAGGDLAGGRKLIEDATRAPRFHCVVSNYTILAEARARNGDFAGAREALSTVIASGLPACGEQRYENARSLENAQRCLEKLTAEPGVQPAWDDDCQ